MKKTPTHLVWKIRKDDIVSVAMGTICYILPISSPAASSSNATEKLDKMFQETEGYASAASTLTRHSFCLTCYPVLILMVLNDMG